MDFHICSMFILLQELTYQKGRHCSLPLHKQIRTCHSRNDLQLLTHAHGPSFARQLGQIFRHVPQYIRTETSATLPLNISTFVNVEEEHSDIFVGECS